MNNIIKRAIGAIVHYYPLTVLEGVGPIAAVVTSMAGDDLVNLCLLQPNGSVMPKFGVRFIGAGATPSDIGFCCDPSVTLLDDVEHAKTRAAAMAAPLAHPSVPGADWPGKPAIPSVSQVQISTLVESLLYQVHHFAGTNSTVALAMLPGGFVVGVGHSACVSALVFDPKIGARIARENAQRQAEDKLWELEGYALSKSLA